MGYIEQNLMPGERVVYRAHLHWVVFLWPAIWFVIGVLLIFTGSSGAAILIGVALLFLAISKYPRRSNSENNLRIKRLSTPIRNQKPARRQRQKFEI